MQFINEELQRVLSQRMKLGEYAKPVCRVEVDRLAFVPGRTQEVSFIAFEPKTQKHLIQTYIDESKGGETLTNADSFVFPVIGKSSSDITSPFGMRNGVQHKGVDVGCAVGSQVVACWSGTVKRVDTNQPYLSYGYCVEIQHNDGVWTRYGHLSKPLVSVGQKVNQGDVIAESGNTGDVTSVNGPVTGTYADPNSPRSKGWGAHLHFEIWLSMDNVVDPYPYITGANKLFTSASNIGGGVVTQGSFDGTVGEITYFYTFATNQWFNDPNITNVDQKLKDISTTGVVQTPINGPMLQFNFNPQMGTLTAGFNFKVSSPKPSVLSLGYASSLGGNGGLKVFINSQLQVNLRSFKGSTVYEEKKDTVFPAGDYDVRVEIDYDGSGNGYLGLNYVKVNSFDPTPDSGNLDKIDPTAKKGYFQERQIEEVIFPKTPKIASLQVGQFVYMDTITLDNVRSVDIDDQFEMDSRDARIVISNPNGYYSPDYNPYYFPERYMDTPWSYFINGFHVGVLSENTPIRIFLGYGLNFMRVFTGLIDKVDMVGENPEMTITCRDMYKRILNYVLLMDKIYPDVYGDGVGGVGIPPDGGTSGTLTSQKEEIIAKAKFYAKQFDGNLDYRFLVAVAGHETEYGTTGAGRPENGSYICGYGVFSTTSKDAVYAGFDRQLYYVAQRYSEAMKSRNWAFNSEDDVHYFWTGGDKGAFQYAGDINWPHATWLIYQGIVADTGSYDSVAEWSGSGAYYGSSNAAPNISASANQKPAWVKSGVVADLAATAGLSGWRRAPEDIFYPDMIIEESYLIDINQAKGTVIKAVPNKEGEFSEQPIDSIMTPEGWLNPFIEEYGKKFDALKYKASDAIGEVISDTNYRTYCDRYGTFRMETINMNKPVVAQFTDDENLVSLTKTVDFSRGRSHIVVFDVENKFEHFVDSDLLMELKGEIRTTVLEVQWARSSAMKRQVAEKMFFDIKRLCRTLQVSIPGNPALDVLDHIYISDRNTTTRSSYTIKGIKTSFSVDNGYLQVIDLTWANDEGAIL